MATALTPVQVTPSICILVHLPEGKNHASVGLAIDWRYLSVFWKQTSSPRPYGEGEERYFYHKSDRSVRLVWRSALRGGPGKAWFYRVDTEKVSAADRAWRTRRSREPQEGRDAELAHALDGLIAAAEHVAELRRT